MLYCVSCSWCCECYTVVHVKLDTTTTVHVVATVLYLFVYFFSCFEFCQFFRFFLFVYKVVVHVYTYCCSNVSIFIIIILVLRKVINDISDTINDIMSDNDNDNNSLPSISDQVVVVVVINKTPLTHLPSAAVYWWPTDQWPRFHTQRQCVA